MDTQKKEKYNVFLRCTRTKNINGKIRGVYIVGTDGLKYYFNSHEDDIHQFYKRSGRYTIVEFIKFTDKMKWKALVKVPGLTEKDDCEVEVMTRDMR